MIRSLKDKTPAVHPSAYVNEAAYVVGDVEIGEGSTVWPCAVLRGDGKIRIGRDTHVQDGTVVHSGTLRPRSATASTSATRSSSTT